MNKKQLLLAFTLCLAGTACIAMNQQAPGAHNANPGPAAPANPPADPRDDEIKRLQDELQKEQNKRPYVIHSPIGVAGPQTDAELGKYYAAQAAQYNSIQNHGAFKAASALANTTLNKIAAPVFVEISKPAFSELWQKYIYQTEGQKVVAEATDIDIEVKRANKISIKESDAHAVRIRALEMQNKLLDNFHKECATGRSETCQEMGPLLEETHKKFIIEFYEQTTGKKYIAPQDRPL